jgi:hypothetical protein
MTVTIGSRWRSGHRVYRDDETGEFSEVNSPLLAPTEWLVQRAMLARPARSLEHLIPKSMRLGGAPPLGVSRAEPPPAYAFAPRLRIHEDRTQ